MGEPAPLEVLRFSKRYGGATTTVDRCDSRGIPYPVWMVVPGDPRRLAVVHADPSLQNPTGAPLGTVRYHRLSHKIDVSYRGADFRMKDDDAGGIKSRHAFAPPGGGLRLAWRRSTMSNGVVYLEDAERRLACFKMRPAGGRPIVELYVPPSTLDMDLLVVTAIAMEGFVRKDKGEDGEHMKLLML